MEQLTAFEFIPAARDGLQLVRLKRQDVVLVEIGFAMWCGVTFSPALLFETREALIIEGQGVGHPYWNDEPPSWVPVFDERAQLQRIETIRAAVQREVNRVLLAH